MHGRIFIIFLVGCLLVACTGPGLQSPYRAWTFTDLRALDPSDDPNPSTDISAVYVREIGPDLQIRLDLLDLHLTPDYTLDLLLDTQPGGSSVCPMQCSSPLQWDLDVHVPADGPLQVFDQNLRLVPDLEPRLVRDPDLDTLTLSFNRSNLPGHFCFQAFTSSYSTWPDDQSSVVCNDDPPPQTRAPLLLAFYNTFEAQTPAQALRAWDGAHTGPLGARHGLGLLVEAALRNRIPIVLLDLKTPARLSALDTVGGTGRLHDLLNANLLLMPDVAYAQPANVSLDYSRRAAQAFDFTASQFFFGLNVSENGYRFRFSDLSQKNHLVRAAGVTYLPLPRTNETTLPTPKGPSLDLRRSLLRTALSGDPTRLVVLGGDLAQSVWGSPDYVDPTLVYLASRPWIQPLNGDDLLTFPTRKITPHELKALESHALHSLTNAQEIILSNLRNAPRNSITDSAWEMFFALTASTSDPALANLRGQYLGQVNWLLAASQWAGHPAALSSCAIDLNKDGRPECVLASDTLYALFDPQGARLILFVARDAQGVYQLIGPSSQLAVGLSDPSLWQANAGSASDPAVITGAFSDHERSQVEYIGQIDGDRLTFTTEDGLNSKIYQLTETGLTLTYLNTGPITTELPLIVAPQAQFHPGWAGGYRNEAIAGGFRWGPQNGPKLSVQATGPVSIRSFNESLTWLADPEDPNFAYPPGHYLPYPLAVIQVKGANNLTIRLDVTTR